MGGFSLELVHVSELDNISVYASGDSVVSILLELIRTEPFSNSII